MTAIGEEPVALTSSSFVAIPRGSDVAYTPSFANVVVAAVVAVVFVEDAVDTCRLVD